MSDEKEYPAFLTLVKGRARIKKCDLGFTHKIECLRCGIELRQRIKTWVMYNRKSGEWKFRQDHRSYTISDRAFLAGFCSEECMKGIV